MTDTSVGDSNQTSAPHGGWVPEWSESYRKASLLVSNMTLAEKTNVTAGSGIFMGRCVGNTGSALRVGIPQLCLQDGPLGVRNSDHNTAFPAGITVRPAGQSFPII